MRILNSDVTVYNFQDRKNYMITETLIDVKNALDSQGFNGINQIVGYLLSDDLSYITDYKDARRKIAKINRDEIIEALLKDYLRNL